MRRHHALLPCAWAALYVARSWWRRAAGPGAYQWTYEFLALSDSAAIAWYRCCRRERRRLVCALPASAAAQSAQLAPDAPEGAVVDNACAGRERRSG